MSADPLFPVRGARLAVEGLSWGPTPTVPIIRDIDLQVAAGEVVGLIGPNGAGKSTVLRCIYRLHRLQRGRILLDGVDLRQLTPRECARRIAVVLQELPADFGLDVRQVAAMGRIPHKRVFEPDTAADAERVDAALTRLGLAALAERAFATLSGGEKQRVLVARALVQQPRLLILDEPTNHLDIRYQIEVLALVRRLGVSVLATIHDLNLAAAYCDRLHLLRAGRIIAAGAPAEVLTTANLRAAFAVETLIDRHPLADRPRVSFNPFPLPEVRNSP